MKGIVKKYGIDAVWHFTDESNLEKIKEAGGLLSYKDLQSKGIVIPCPGGNDWSHDADVYKGVDGYVHLAFKDQHPMLFRAVEHGTIKKPVWLKIKSDVLHLSGTRFTADVSNKSGIRILSSKEAEEAIDFEVLYTWTDWRNPDIKARLRAARKSEILVPDIVPWDFITEIRRG